MSDNAMREAMAARYTDISAEQAVLGSMLLDPTCIRDVEQKLREADFASSTNQELYRAIISMDMGGKRIDALTVADEVRGGSLDDIKAMRKYITQLLEITPTAANVHDYAEIVAETARRRTLREALRTASEELDNGSPQEDILPALESAVETVNTRTSSELLSPKEQLDAFYAYREQIEDGGLPGVRTGLRQVDKLLGCGMINKGLYFLAARPGMGKTALAIAIAEQTAIRGMETALVSMEMSTEQVMARRIAAEAKVNSELVLMETLTDDEYRRTAEAAQTLGQRPMYITGGKSYAPGQLAAIVRGRRKCKLVIVDHFGLFMLPNKQPSHVEYGMAAHSLKRLAQAMDCPVLCLAQLNRENETRPDKRPRLSDLRATGAVEEDADGVIFLHRPDYYDQDFKREGQEPLTVELRIAKNRHGKTGKVDLSFWPETNIFREKYVR